MPSVDASDSDGSRRRGQETWRALLQRVAHAGGSLADWGDVTLAELDEIARTRRLEEWDRAAFVATCAFNANPFLKSYTPIKNPFRNEEDYVVKVDLESVF